VLVAVGTSRLCCGEAGIARIFAPVRESFGESQLQAKFDQALALHQQGKLADAERIYSEVLRQQPNHFDALHLLGVIAAQTRRTERGIELITKAIGLNAKVAAAHNNLGIALQDLKRSEEALASYDKALAIKPDYAEAYFNRGIALKELRRTEEALASYDKAIALKPDYAEAHNNRGNALQDLKRTEEALASYERALAATVDYPHAFSGAADCVMKLCDWDKRTRFAPDINAHVSGKKSIVYPFVLLSYSGDPALQLRCARNSIENTFPLLPPPFWSGQTWRHDKLRVAYLSADFRSHPVAYLTAELFEQHDRSHFEIIGVSFGLNDGGEMRKRLVAAFDEFHDVRRTSDKEVAKLLYDRPGIPVVPEDVATEYLPRNCRPISSGLSTNVRTALRVTSRSVIQSSKRSISFCLLTTGRMAGFSTRSGRCR
jgi:predicted O-linked N-acetylglucosamine transferase (SPINDLY family)